MDPVLACLPVVDLQRQITNIPGPIFFSFMQFLGNFGRIIGWRGIGVSFLINPGSTTDFIYSMHE